MSDNHPATNKTKLLLLILSGNPIFVNVPINYIGHDGVVRLTHNDIKGMNLPYNPSYALVG